MCSVQPFDAVPFRVGKLPRTNRQQREPSSSNCSESRQVGAGSGSGPSLLETPLRIRGASFVTLGLLRRHQAIECPCVVREAIQGSAELLRGLGRLAGLQQGAAQRLPHRIIPVTRIRGFRATKGL